MATKNYMINDKWLDLDKQNIVELQSVDGELDNIKVNGSEIVTPSGKITITENGTDIDIAQYATADVNVAGGSSDFSTATVTVGVGVNFQSPIVVDVQEFQGTAYFNDTVLEQTAFIVPLYKGKCTLNAYKATPSGVVTISGNIQDIGEGAYLITGDCTITIS